VDKNKPSRYVNLERAIINRSRLVTSPLRFQAKRHFLRAFNVLISWPKNQFLINNRGARTVIRTVQAIF